MEAKKRPEVRLYVCVCMCICVCMYVCVHVYTVAGAEGCYGGEEATRGAVVCLCVCVYLYVYVCMCAFVHSKRSRRLL